MDHLLHIENTDDGDINNADGTNDGDDGDVDAGDGEMGTKAEGFAVILNHLGRHRHPDFEEEAVPQVLEEITGFTGGGAW